MVFSDSAPLLFTISFDLFRRRIRVITVAEVHKRSSEGPLQFVSLNTVQFNLLLQFYLAYLLLYLGMVSSRK